MECAQVERFLDILVGPESERLSHELVILDRRGHNDRNIRAERFQRSPRDTPAAPDYPMTHGRIATHPFSKELRTKPREYNRGQPHPEHRQAVGEQREPFFMRTFAPTGQRYGRRETIIKQSRMKYASRRVDVEGKIARWMEN